MRCGVLALQGDWAAHVAVLASLGIEADPIRTVAELDSVDGLILPGGESTAMLRLMSGKYVEKILRPSLTEFDHWLESRSTPKLAPVLRLTRNRVRRQQREAAAAHRASARAFRE